MTRAEYEESICQRLEQAVRVPHHKVLFADGSEPFQSACHENVDRWVKENPGFTPVWGWVTYVDYWVSVGLTAHAIVRDQRGQLIDITPLGNERERAGMRFVPHTGTREEFMSMKQADIFINCPIA
jgi:hypothetical protein